jgi:hypothetical protein
MGKKPGIEILPAAFTDHHAVALRLAIDTHVVRGGRGRRKMVPKLIQDDRIKVKVRHNWAIWQTHKRYYPDVTSWWELYVKNIFDASRPRKQ